MGPAWLPSRCISCQLSCPAWVTLQSAQLPLPAWPQPLPPQPLTLVPLRCRRAAGQYPGSAAGEQQSHSGPVLVQ
jgi:hypothetical protein